MYEEFYNLTEKPFSLTPDPKFLFLSKKHRDAFEILLYGIRRKEGFSLLTGGVGTGKTMLCRALLERLDPNIKVALILNPMLSEEELLKAVLQDLGLDYSKNSRKELIDELNSFLLSQASSGRNTVLILDEAQNLSTSVLEQVRILSNLETEKEKLIHIILVGQEELMMNLRRPTLRQLNQRISTRYHLEHLARSEVQRYIEHRLMVAGSSGEISFPRSTINFIYKHSRGIPRVINLICDRVLLGGYVEQKYRITKIIAKKAVKELKINEVIFPKKLTFMSVFKFILIPLFIGLLIVGFLVFKANIFIPKLIPVKSDTADSISLNSPEYKLSKPYTDHGVQSFAAVNGEGAQSTPAEGYAVYVFSHRDRNEAERMLEVLQLKGYVLHIEVVKQPNGLLHRVASVYFPDIGSSIKMVRDLAKMNIHATITHRSKGSELAEVTLFRISLGIYKQLTNAENLVTKLKDKGYDIYTSELGQGSREVFMGPYVTKNDCELIIKTLQNSEADFPISIQRW